MTTYTIDQLYAGAWQNAISNVSAILCISEDAWKTIESIAYHLKVRFDINGNIV